MKDTFEEVVEFIQSKIGLESKPLDRSTRLYEDLRIAGDDAFELMSVNERYAKRYSSRL